MTSRGLGAHGMRRDAARVLMRGRAVHRSSRQSEEGRKTTGSEHGDAFCSEVGGDLATRATLGVELASVSVLRNSPIAEARVPVLRWG